MYAVNATNQHKRVSWNAIPSVLDPTIGLFFFKKKIESYCNRKAGILEGIANDRPNYGVT